MHWFFIYKGSAILTDEGIEGEKDYLLHKINFSL